MHKFQKIKILQLRWGEGPYNFSQHVRVYLKLKEISLVVGVKIKTISKFLTKFKKD